MDSQSSIYADCVGSLKGKTSKQYKTLTKTILPRVALYKALKNDSKLSPFRHQPTFRDRKSKKSGSSRKAWELDN